MAVDRQFAEWLAGFWEGDGRLLVGNEPPVADFNDLDNSPIHEYIQSTLGFGKLGSGWLGFEGEDCYHFLDIVKPYLVSALRQEKVARVLNCTFGEKKPTLDWLVGLWDADGSSASTGRRVSISIGKTDFNLIASLKLKFGGSFSFSSFPVWTLSCNPCEGLTQILSTINYVSLKSKNPSRQKSLISRLRSAEKCVPSSKYGSKPRLKKSEVIVVDSSPWLVTCTFQSNRKSYPLTAKSFYKARVTGLDLFLREFSIPGKPWEYLTKKKGTILCEVESFLPRKNALEVLDPISEEQRLGILVDKLTSEQKRKLHELLNAELEETSKN